MVKIYFKEEKILNKAFKAALIVLSISMVGCSGGGTSTVTLTPATLPNAPTSTFASAKSSTQIDITWTDNSGNEDGFKIERSTDGTNFTQIATVVTSVTTFTNTGLEPATTYHYRVQAFNSNGVSNYSNISSATTQNAPLGAPSVPSGLSATTISGTQIDLKWTDNSSNEDGFKIERGNDGISFTEIAQVTANITVYSNTGLAGSTKYYFRVRAYNLAGNSTYSSTASSTTFGTPTSKPADPSELSTVAVSSSQINLNWTDNSTNEDKFIVERSLDSANFTEIGTVVSGINVFGNIGLSPSTRYYYRVKAANSAGDSNYSNIADATTFSAPASPPSAPSSLATIVISSTQIDLSWNDNSSNEDDFKLERSTDGNTFAPLVTLGANVTNYNDTGLLPSTQYWYRVKAHNSAGDSNYSNVAFATTQAAPVIPPAAPTGLIATAASSSVINLIWTDNSNNEIEFWIERSINNNVNFVQIATVAAGVSSYSNIGLTANTTYFYRVRASNTAGQSGFSNEVNATTQAASPIPTAPSGLVVTGTTQTTVSLAWTDNSFNEDGFKLDRGIDSFDKLGNPTVLWVVNYRTVGVNVTTFTDTGLTQGKRYYYRVRAYNLAGSSSYSNTLSVITTGGPDPGQ